MQLTKDGDKLVCLIYKSYLEKRKSGLSKSDSKYFDYDFYKKIPAISNWLDDDIFNTLQELKNASFIKLYIDGGFLIQDSFIIYMENRFKNGLAEITDFISKFIPW